MKWNHLTGFILLFCCISLISSTSLPPCPPGTQCCSVNKQFSAHLSSASTQYCHSPFLVFAIQPSLECKTPPFPHNLFLRLRNSEILMTTYSQQSETITSLFVSESVAQTCVCIACGPPGLPFWDSCLRTGMDMDRRCGSSFNHSQGNYATGGSILYYTLPVFLNIHLPAGFVFSVWWCWYLPC